MPLIRKLPTEALQGDLISIPVERRVIEKLRWRGVAEDGVEFAFDLSRSLNDGDIVWGTEGKAYRVVQQPEPTLHIPWPKGVVDSAKLAWNLGNLHQPIEIRDDGIYVNDDPAVQQKLTRLGIEFRTVDSVFRPMSGAMHQH